MTHQDNPSNDSAASLSAAGDVTDREEKDNSALLGLMIWVGGAALVAAANWESFSSWVLEHLVVFLVACALVALVVVWIGVRSAWRSPTGQIGSIISLGIPLILALAVAVWMIPLEYRVSVLRSVFLVIVIFLPALLYFLFVALRRISLLQEFFTNLARLGLLDRRQQGSVVELERDRKIRVTTYLQKFEAIYGAIPQPLVQQILDQTDPDVNPKHVPQFHLYQSSLFTPEAIPVLVATVLISLGWLLVLPPWEFVGGGTTWSEVLKPTKDAALFAFLGAYFYAVQMLYRRFVRRDLRANAYVSISQRIILAVVGIWAVLQVFSALPGSFFFTEGGKGQHDSLLVIGFVVGAFPPIAWQVMQAAFRKLTRAEVLVPSLNSPMPLRELDGLTVWHEGRLEEEDIENVQNMATANLVELMLHTRYPPDRIVDWVDQAMLYTQLGKENIAPKDAAGTAVKRLQGHGIRTASSLVAVYDMRETHCEKDGSGFQPLLAGDAKESRRITDIVAALSTNPNIELVQRWNGSRQRT
jgi:hypothetical protein